MTCSWVKMSRADYAHWNEDADWMWYQEEGRFGSESPDPDFDGPMGVSPEEGPEDFCQSCGEYFEDCECADGDDGEPTRCDECKERVIHHYGPQPRTSA